MIHLSPLPYKYLLYNYLENQFRVNDLKKGE